MIGLVWALPKGALTLVKEAARHVLRHPVVGVAIAARTRDGRWLFIRRADTLTWGFAGGTLEWGENMRAGAARELLEEAGVSGSTFLRVVGVYSDPARDPRFHAVTVLCLYEVDAPTAAPVNPLEILEVRAFAAHEVPAELALGARDMFDDALASGSTRFE